MRASYTPGSSSRVNAEASAPSCPDDVRDLDLDLVTAMLVAGLVTALVVSVVYLIVIVVFRTRR